MEVRIKSLYLKDFNNVEELSLDLNYNIVSICGDTGSGKSSIIEAIQYLFTGTLNNRIQDYVRWGAKEFVIQGEFSIDNNNFSYEVKGGKKTEKKLIVNDIEEYYNSDATKKMEEYLDSVLMSFIISNQGKADELLFVGGAERLQKFKKLFKLDDLIKVIEGMKEDRLLLTDSLKENTTKRDTLKNIKYIYQDVLEIEGDIDDLKNKLNILENEKEVFEKKSKEYALYIFQQKEYENYILKKADIEKRMSDKENLLNIISDIIIPDYDAEKHKDYIDTKNSLTILYTNYTNKWENYNNSKSEKNNLEEHIIKYQKAIQNNTIQRLPRLSFTEDDLYKLKEEKEKIREKYLFFKTKYDAVKDGKCPTCYADYNVSDISEFLDNKNKYEALYHNILKEYNDNEEKLNEYKKVEAENKIKQSKIDGLNDNIRMVEDKIKLLSNIVEPEIKTHELHTQIIETDKQISFFNEAKIKYDEAIKKQSDIEKSKFNIQKEVDLIKKEKELLTIIECPVILGKPEEFNNSLYEKIKKDINIYEQKCLERERIIEFNKKIKKEEKSNISEISLLDKEIQDDSYKLTVINESIKIIDKDFSAWLIDKGSEFIKNRMNDFFSKTYGRYEVSYENDGKTLEFFFGTDETIKAPILKASGYEKQILGVAFRLAIIQLAKTNLFIGDEIDSNSADERSLSLYENILEENYLNQFINITHKSNTQEFLNNVANSIQYELKEGQIIN